MDVSGLAGRTWVPLGALTCGKVLRSDKPLGLTRWRTIRVVGSDEVVEHDQGEASDELPRDNGQSSGQRGHSGDLLGMCPDAGRRKPLPSGGILGITSAAVRGSRYRITLILGGFLPHPKSPWGDKPCQAGSLVVHSGW